MKLKQLESALSILNISFPNPQIKLEQYPTSAHLAAAVALTAHEKGDLFWRRCKRIKSEDGECKVASGCRICDLGCGTGMLSLAFALVLNYLEELENEENDFEQYDQYGNKMITNTNETNYDQYSVNDDDDDDGNTRICENGEVVGIDICKEALECAQNNKDILLELEYLEQNIPTVEFIHAELQYEAPQKEYSSSSGHGGRNNKKGGRGHSKGKDGKRGQKSKQKKIVSSLVSLPYSTTFHNYNDNLPFPSHIFDTVITNPPFGTKHNEGIDVAFLAAACRLSRKAVYSFHKSSTRSYLINLIEKEWNKKENISLSIEVVAEMKFEIPNMYKFHKEKSVDVDVDLIRIWHNNDPSHKHSNEVVNKNEMMNKEELE